MLDECDSPLPMRKSFTVVLKEDSVMRLWGTFPSRFTMYDYYYYVAYTGIRQVTSSQCCTTEHSEYGVPQGSSPIVEYRTKPGPNTQQKSIG